MVCVGGCRGDTVEIVAPQPAQIFGWGRQAPSVRLEARAVSSQPAQRVFLSAIITDAQGKTVDRVPLYDDGTHSDSHAGDLSFTALYTPRTEGIFQVRFKAEWERNSQRVARFSEARSFEVVRAPYARFVDKLAEERPSVGASVSMSVALLTGNDEPYKGSLESITLQASSNPNGSVEIPQSLTSQPKIRYQFAHPGEYRLTVQAVMNYKGQQIVTEPDTMTVIYNTPPWWLWGLGFLLLVVGILINGKHIPVYEHEFSEQDPNTGIQNTLHLWASEPRLELENGQVVLEYVPGSRQVKLAQGKLSTMGEEPVERGVLLNEGERYRTPSGKILQFRETIERGAQPVTSRWVPNTFPKILTVLAGILLIVYYFYLKNQIAQSINL
ncbi:MAG: hypothetical protein CFK49_02195 [Armatimonadetes bacterium JP3_11]|nr:MAG: hypothetical protein CFK49_02195 [Armatimonadetes bacterium JP3_11]